MGKRATSLAKLCRPKLHGVFPRERLFALLDARRQHPIIWLSGPPGTGKTALVASYLEARKLPGIWYQVDSGDTDLATFFYHMSLAAAHSLGRKARNMPLLTPDFLPDLPAFTRHYFRDLFSRMPRPCTVVLDNFQEAKSPPAMRELVAAAFEEVPEGVTVLVLSHAAPPPELMRLVATRRLTLIDWDALQLTLDETKQIASCQGVLDEAIVSTLHQRAGGWPAGLVLMLEHLKYTGRGLEMHQQSSQQAVFNYFAGEIFNKLLPEARELLQRTAYLPEMTEAMAVQLSGHANAAKFLDYLYRHCLFTDRRRGPHTTYQFHALFREFLLARARQAFPVEQQIELAGRAGELLEADGQANSAAQLYCEAQAWDRLAQLICAQAASLTEQGRHQLLQTWIDALPATARTGNPWLLYWQGMSRLPFNPSDSRSNLERAFEGFKHSQDGTGAFLAWAGVMETYFFEWGNRVPVDKWVAELEQLMARYPTFPSLAIEARVVANCYGLVFRRPDHQLFSALNERAQQLLENTPDPQQRLLLANFIVHYHLRRGELIKAGVVVNEINTKLEFAKVAPFNLIHWRISEIAHGWLTSNFDLARTAIDAALALAEHTGIHSLDFTIYTQAVNTFLSMGDVQQAENYLARMAALKGAVADPKFNQDYFHRAGVAFLKGDFKIALEYGQRGVEYGEQLGRLFYSASGHIGLARILACMGEPGRGREQLARAFELARGISSSSLEFHCWLTEARCLFALGDSAQANAALRAAMAIGRQQEYLGCDPWWVPKHMSFLCARALEAGIETDYVQTLIRGRGLQAPAGDIENWPWPIRVYTLGRFSMVREGETLALPGKTQKRPIELLKALIALGGREVSSAALIQTLWPDSQGDAGHSTFEATLHRLRKMLGREEAILLSDAKLTLNPRLVWVDVWAFERQAGSIHELLRQTDAPTGQIEQTAEQLFRLYRGHFLQLENDQPWTLPPREKLRSRLLRQVIGLGQYWEGNGAWGKAIELYQRGLELDPLAEELYRRLMACYYQQGQLAAGVEVYRRCRQMLSVVLGIAPAAETEAMHQTLRA